MKKFGVCCFAALCVALSGCAGGPVSSGAAEVPVQTEAPPQEMDSEAGGEPEADVYAGVWVDADDPRYSMTISGGDGYTIEIAWSGGPRGAVVWRLSGTYDDVWKGIAYVGAKYEETAGEDAPVQRLPAPEREEITGLICLEEDGTLSWIDDFDHAGDGLQFVKE